MARQFIDLKSIYPAETIETSSYLIKRHKVSKIDIEAIKNANVIGSLYVDKLIEGNEQVVLLNSDMSVMMSDHPSETITNQKFIDNAKGNVLIFGLGLGLIVFPLLKDKDIKGITIIENDFDLIRFVSEIIKKHDIDNKVKIELGNAFTYFEKLKGKYDTIYFDIWANINSDSRKQMDELHELYKSYLADNGYMDSWCYNIKN